MTKVTSFAVLTLLALGAFSACTDVRKCTRGEKGCIDGEPDNDECAAGLVPKNGECVPPEGGGGGGRCNCASDEICDEDGETCLAYCEPVDDPPESVPTPPSCKPVKTVSNDNPTPFTYRELCVKTCMQDCARAQTFCPGYVCNESECESVAALARCAVACPGMDTSCMENKCNERSATSCDDFTCPTGAPAKSCQGLRCTDSCQGNNKDGFCDDGDPYSATYSFCSYGTDCTDCGPRRGTRPAGIALGEPCPEGQDVSCQGYNDDFLKTQAWCLRFSSEPGAAFRCVPDCTTEDGAGNCPDGYECQGVKNSNGDPYQDATPNRTPGYACVPQICE